MGGLCSTLDYKVGQKVRSCRLAKGYTQKDLAKKVGIKYWLILQYEKGNRKIPIKKLYAIAEALSTSARVLVSEQTDEKRCFENEGEGILNLVKIHKEIKDQELREIFYLLTKFIRISEERSGKAVKIEVARGLVKEGVSAHVISRTTNLSISEYEEKKISIPYKVGQRIKEWRLRREYTQEDLANKVGITNQRIYEYEQGRAAVSLETLDEIAKVLSISIIDLLPESTEDENSEVGLSNLIEEYKKIESQELRDVLIKSLFEGIHVCNEKIREAKKVEVAKSLVKEGVSVDIISQATRLSTYEYDDTEKEIRTDSVLYKVGKRIKEQRLIRGYTQEDLASKIGLTPKEIHDYEQGYTDIPIEILDKIAKVLSVNINALFLGLTEYENESVLKFIGKCKKIEDQELLDAVVKSLSEGMQTGKEKVKNANSGLRKEESIGNRRLFGFDGIGNESRKDMNQEINRGSMASVFNF